MTEIGENKLSDSDLPIIDESIDSVSKSTTHYLKRHTSKVVSVVGLVVAIEIALALLQIKAGQLYIMPFVVLFFLYFSIKSKIEKEFMQQFALANNYTFSDAGVLDQGELFEIGHDQRAINMVSGMYKNYPMRLYELQYTVGYGKNSHTYKNTIFSLEFDADMPDILLESKLNTIDGASFGGNIVKLEGDFNEYFTLHVPKGYEVEALQVFTPDIMATLIDKAAPFTIEIANNNFILCHSGLVEEKDKLYAMYEMAQYFIEKLGPIFVQMKASMPTQNFTNDNKIKISIPQFTSIGPVVMYNWNIIFVLAIIIILFFVNIFFPNSFSLKW